MFPLLDAKNAQFLADLDRIQSRSERAQRQLSSGLRINSLADHPDEIGALLQMRAELAGTVQTKENLARAKTETDAMEGAISNAIDAVERVRVLGAQAMTGTQTAETRAVIAGEVEALLRQLVGISNSAIDGRYLFSGSTDQSPPYSLDLSTSTGATAYAGGAATRQIPDASGERMNLARTGQEIFDAPMAGRSLFGAVKQLRDALLLNDETAIEAGMANLGTALTHANEQLAYFGSVQNRVASAIASADRKVLQLRTGISEVEGADLAESILELQQSATHRQAALQAKSQEDRRTVFDFLR